jgi:hypothetical protein
LKQHLYQPDILNEKRIFFNQMIFSFCLYGNILPENDKTLRLGKQFFMLNKKYGMPGRKRGMPARKVGMPAKKGGMPARKVGMPAKKLGMPVRKGGMPAGKLGMPARKGGMPARKVGMPAGKLGMPERKGGKVGNLLIILSKHYFLLFYPKSACPQISKFPNFYTKRISGIQFIIQRGNVIYRICWKRGVRAKIRNSCFKVIFP